MAENCPHCGAKLPWVVDAFCPACDERLDETLRHSEKRGVLVQTGNNGAWLMRGILGVLFLLTGLLLIGMSLRVVFFGTRWPYATVVVVLGLGLVGTALIVIFYKVPAVVDQRLPTPRDHVPPPDSTPPSEHISE